MKKTIVLIIAALMMSAMLWAGEIARVSATYEYISNNPDETPAQAEAKAFERARLKALEEKFGLDVSQVTNTYVQNSGEVSETNVFSMGGTAVRGEWIETIQEKVLDKKFVDGFWIVKVSVVGKARNHSTEKTDIHFAFVRDVNDVEPPVTFRDGNDIFLRFSSPVAGSLCVYLVGEDQNAYCLLPYPKQQTGSQAIEANKEYIFFSPKYDPQAQDYTLTCERNSEQNALYVIFSPTGFTKANDKEGGLNWRQQTMPRELSHQAFLKWLERNQMRDEQMVVRREIITIHK